LRDIGPKLGRPLVDSIAGSTIHNMKELRPGSSGSTEIRVLFVFDAKRQAVLLVGGDKSNDYVRWYRKNIPLAEARFALYLEGEKDD
ncbi:MAG: type II toxin-antitoxin system RelE/ParE family toxin, partial [Actinomycetales bacterium]|nr:type II toxin-antitoxin system RelE/ParE family toxin [Actinomycetales bacterium]